MLGGVEAGPEVRVGHPASQNLGQLRGICNRNERTVSEELQQGDRYMRVSTGCVERRGLKFRVSDNVGKGAEEERKDEGKER